jgi:D-alanyl-D-alanine carboxypeptidase
MSGAQHAFAEALLLVDAESGKVLHAENATHPWYPASVTKLMTTYVTLRAVKGGRLEINKLLTISANAAAQQPSKMGFKAGLQITVDNALKMLMVKSANDMAVVLAEGVSGSVERFAGEMNDVAQQLGMTQTSYVNPNGLPDERQVTSARDLAILARALIRDFPEYDFYLRIPAIKLGKKIMRNYNPLIDRYPGADGMKTGFICASGYNLVASATHGNKRMIAVVLGATSGPARAIKAVQLLEKGFNGGNNGLAWLAPSLGSVESLTPVAADPPNFYEDMCGKHRHRPASDNPEDELAAGKDLDPSSAAAIMAEGQKGEPGKPVIPQLAPILASSPPIEVFVGAAKRKPSPTVTATATPRPAQTKPRKPQSGANDKNAGVTPTLASSPGAPKPAPASGSAPKTRPAVTQ